MKAFIRGLVRRTGFDVVRYRPSDGGLKFPSDVPDSDREIVVKATRFSMTSMERMLATIHSVRHVVRSGLPGSIVECGVWKGGGMMAAAYTLMAEGDTSRDIFLFDTFEGMTEPTDADRSGNDVLASAHLSRIPKGTGSWCYAGIDEVRTNLASTGYPQERLHFVKGPVEQTLPMSIGSIAVLRLDTDWYESTRHELIHLFPLLVEGGILMIDDYGHWKGSRKATDEFLATTPKRYFLNRIDYTGRLLVK